jgi:hypothetical protein
MERARTVAVGRQGSNGRTARISARHRRLAEAIPELGTGDHRRRRLDLRAADRGRGGGRGQLGTTARLPGPRPRPGPHLVAPRAIRRGVERGARAAGRHHALSQPHAHGPVRSQRDRHADGRRAVGRPGVPADGRSRVDRASSAGGSDDRRRARDRWPWHRNPRPRRAPGAWGDLRLGQQSDPVAQGRRLERAPPPLRVADVRPRRPGVRQPADCAICAA